MGLKRQEESCELDSNLHRLIITSKEKKVTAAHGSQDSPSDADTHQRRAKAWTIYEINGTLDVILMCIAAAKDSVDSPVTVDYIHRVT